LQIKLFRNIIPYVIEYVLRGWVRFPTGGKVREPMIIQGMNRCDSGTDSRVWMREE